MKKILLFVSLLCSALFSNAEQFDGYNTDIDDLALIYIGSQHRPAWTKDLFRPYVMHTYADGTKSWMFDGFLMIEFMAYNENGEDVGFGEYNGYGAKKTDWERLLDQQLGLSNNQGCKALDELIGELLPELGTPGHKHKVVMTVPLAETKSALNWGRINNVQMNFQSTADRQTAMKWYVDQLIEKWNEAGFKNIELDGFYWVRETFGSDEKQVIPSVNDYIHSKGLKAYWIPYSTAQGRAEWKDFGIDVAYLQPNYYFNDTVPITRFDVTIPFALEHEMAMEMEFEGYNFSWNVNTQQLTRVTPRNIALYELNPRFYQRLVDYIDKFEEYWVFEALPVAYYSGFEGVYDLENSGSQKNKEVLDRLASIINQRHVWNGWDKEPSAGINDIVTDGKRSPAYGIDGAIYIADAAGSDVKIYGTDGRLVYSHGVDQCSERLNYGITISCTPGIYIVKIAGESVKVAVR